MRENRDLLGLYIHWPYCESKCPYCDFNSHIEEQVDDQKWIEAFANQLYRMREELHEHGIKFNGLNSIFFGGGTPSLMPLKVIEKLLDLSFKIFNFNNNIEITLETNPSSYEVEKFLDLKKIGINRLSLGAQSLNNKNLKFLGRKHNVNQINKALDHACKIFNNISADLIYAFYGQDLNTWINELETFLNRFNLNHISLYQLTIERGTKFFTNYKKGLLTPIDNDVAYKFYNNSNKILKKYNLNRYEVSNYCKNGFECKHNLIYWNSENWIGVGPGAYGRIWSSRPKYHRLEYQNFKNPKTWLNKNFKGTNFEAINLLKNKITDYETVIMGLRLVKGFNISKLYDKNLLNNDRFNYLTKKKILYKKGNVIKVHKNYIVKLDSVINFLFTS